jgi:hypothetical protein
MAPTTRVPPSIPRELPKRDATREGSPLFTAGRSCADCVHTDEDRVNKYADPEILDVS